MANEERIVNRIITKDTVLNIASYLRDKVEEYKRLNEQEAKQNKGLMLKDQVYKYKFWGVGAELYFEITYIDNKIVKREDYNWFLNEMENTKIIKKIGFIYTIEMKDNSKSIDKTKFKRIHTYIVFQEDTIYLLVEGKEMEEEEYNLHNTLKNMIENNETRYNKTVKNKNFRIQSFCLSIGFILSYIIYVVLLICKDNLPNILNQLMNNKYALIFGQWFIAAFVGNLIGYPIMMNLYKNIAPKRKSHYSAKVHKVVYTDNIDDFIEHNEIQIGRFSDNGEKRALIEKIYKITNKIILVQLVLSILYFIILK